MERPRPYCRLVAFIDWNSRLLALKAAKSKHSAIDFSAYVLKTSAIAVARWLSTNFPSEKFSVDVRIYHGWHKGFEPTENRKALERAIAITDFASLSGRANVVYSGRVDYGDRLLIADACRLHARPLIHLPNTLRKQRRHGPDVEKMVDTAMAADVVTTAFQDPESWILVMAEDDDLVPPLYAAEAIVAGSGSRVLLMRTNTPKGPFLKLDGIICEAA